MELYALNLEFGIPPDVVGRQDYRIFMFTVEALGRIMDRRHSKDKQSDSPNGYNQKFDV